MDFAKSEDPRLENLRSAIIMTMPCIDGMGAEEREAAAYAYWEIEVRNCCIEHQFESAWHFIQLAALAEDAFKGPDRICRGHVEGQPIGLTCSPKGVMHLIQLLYCYMSNGGIIPEDKKVNPLREQNPWGDLFPSGNRIAMMMYKQHELHFILAGLEALSIADWANNHRRYAFRTAA
jgi:hypothetical protein